MAKILIIDDDSEMRMMLKDMLTREGHEITLAADGADGIDKAEKSHYDLIVTDILMAQCGGFEVLQYCHKTGQACKVIAISGGGDIQAEEYLRCASALGASCTFQKPFDRSTFLQAVQSLLA